MNREIRERAKNHGNALAPPTQISREIAKGKQWLSNTQRFMAGCTEMGGTVYDKEGNKVHSGTMDNSKVELDGIQKSIDDKNKEILVCETQDATIAAKRNPNNLDEILVVKAQDSRAHDYIVNPDIEASPELKALGEDAEMEIKARQGKIRVSGGEIREIDRPSKKVSEGEAMQITGKDNPEEAMKTVEYQSKTAKSELDKAVRGMTR